MIYVANPYTSKDINVMHERYKQVEKYTAYMMKSGSNIISPIVHSHYLALNHDMPKDFEFWESWCMELLSLCDEVHVLQLDGWQESIGTKSEIDYAKSNGFFITYVPFELLESI